MKSKELAQLLALRAFRERRAAQTLAQASASEQTAQAEVDRALLSENLFQAKRNREEVRFAATLIGVSHTIGEIMAAGDLLQNFADQHARLQRSLTQSKACVKDKADKVASAREAYRSTLQKSEVSKHLAAKLGRATRCADEQQEEIETDAFPGRLNANLRR